MGERHAVLDAELDTHEVSNTSEHSVQEVKSRRHKHESELDWLSNSGEERSECGRDHDATDSGPILGSRTTPDSNRCCWEAPHLEQITARHVSSRRITGYISLYLAANDPARGWIRILANLKEERYVPDVVETKRD